MHIALIVKTSKLCNLRCVYCYETPELANKERMSHENIEKMFRHVRTYISEWQKPQEKHQLEFIWHGGEPFAQPVSYWNRILELQQQVFGADVRIAIRNDVQTNLTLVTKKHLPLLRDFYVGFSYDVINDYRVRIDGRETADVVVKKADWLREQGIRIGGIAVISKKNIDHVAAVADFFTQRNLAFRALNIYQAKDSLPQIDDSAVSFERYLQFYKDLYRLPQVKEALAQKCPVDPLFTSESLYRQNRNGQLSNFSEERCAEKEWAVMVNTNGDVYSPGDAYDPEYRYGNIFSQSLEELMFQSPGRKKRVQKSRERLAEVCTGCFLYRKGCDGTFVSHATPEEFRDFQRMKGCYHKHLAEMMKNEDQPDATPARDTLYLNITYRCNSRCLFCAADVAYKRNSRELSLVDFQNLLRGKQYREIQLSGGEPTIHPDFLEMARLSRKHAAGIVLLSHGRGFQKMEFAEEVIRAGVNSLVIPLYGPDAETHDRVSKVKGSFAQTVKGFLNLEKLKSHYNFSVELKMLLTAYTAPLNSSIYRFAKQTFPRAIDQVSICPLIYSRSTLDYLPEFSSPFESLKQELFALIDEIQKEDRCKLRINEFPACFFPQKNMRELAHPNLHSPVIPSRKMYADDQFPDEFSMNDRGSTFRKNTIGNALVESCKECMHRDYCAQRQTPYFSAAYLEQFGEKEFHPVTL